MIFLIGSIVFSSYLTLSFKLLERYGINNLHAIVFNYITCVVTGTIINGHNIFKPVLVQQPWFPWAILMGSLFISLFNIIGYTAQRSGVSVASVANKLSLVIPFIFSIVLYDEQPTVLKIAGILLAFPAVIWVSQREGGERSATGKPIALPLLPLVLFIGSGLLDTLIKFVENSFLDGSNNNDFLICAFAVAATFGIGIIGWQIINGKARLNWQAVVAGIAIGVPNYFSIWCLVKVLKVNAGKSSAIIPVNNMGIVAFSTLVAAVLFHEKLSRKNWLGIFLSMAAIALIAYG
jgi:drug/metabolite transporter (DMT)-like permease